MVKRSGSQIYKNASDLEAAFRRLDAEPLATPDKELVKRFVNTWMAKGYTKSRGVKLVYSMRKLACILAKPFEQAKEMT